MGRHTNPDTLQFKSELEKMGNELGYTSIIEYPMPKMHYDIDLVWMHPEQAFFTLHYACIPNGLPK